MFFEGEQQKVLADLLKTGDYSDLTISCGKDQYHVHKAIICPRSPFFKAACDGKFKEAQTGTIDLPDDDPIAVRMMIEYLYHATYMPPDGTTIIRDDAIDAHLSETEYNDEQEKGKMELYGATFIGNKRIKRLTALPEAPNTPISHPLPSPFGPAAPTTPLQPAASQGPSRGSGQSRQGRGVFAGLNLPSGHNPPQASPNQSSSTPGPSSFTSPAPSPTPPPPQRSSARQQSIPAANLHLHAKVYALGEKYSIKPLKTQALAKFEVEAPFHFHTDDFLQAIREVYTSTIETDRPLRDAVVVVLRSNKHLLKKESVKAILKDTTLGLSFDMVMGLASE
ncbi:uncharacterized protein FMAN_14510 [Fusarium mangiferae]|uniref:BTB domain-containing protein n=1 Tax=Fusarium mangiferae TaxID=192010 RepID=A0A1L7UGZ6_FUSMA|nr:uncharacterized protein FMAN_14510 [Fusarium mangiferae]CVL07633.1 uncharacterized protein FMAN_14510 [Fusarium mangiferae]